MPDARGFLMDATELETVEPTATEKKVAAAGRLMSLDALRGFDMVWIIGGDGIVGGVNRICQHPITEWMSRQFNHARWEGFTFEDIIMPLFLFIVGTAMPFSFSKHLASGQSKARLYLHIIKRVIILWILGMMVQGKLLSYDWTKFRLYSNTLQAIAAGYFFSSIILLHFKIRWQAIITGGLVLLYWALMTWVPVPGFGAGVLTEDGNLANYIDHLVLGRFDDGLNYTWVLSTMTFTATVMLGVLAGQWLRSNRTEKAKVLGLFAAGAGLLVAGMVWGIWSPIIKRLWTSSFVLYSGGLCVLLLAAFYLIIDVWKFRKWSFILVVIGMNAIAVYVGSHLFNFHLVTNIFLKGLEGRLGVYYGLVYELATFAIIWLILHWMYRKKSFIKI